MKPENRIQKAIETHDGMIAYDVFLEKTMELANTVSTILNETPESLADWVRDQLLDIACNHLESIRSPAAWHAFIKVAVSNRARNLLRKRHLRRVQAVDEFVENSALPDDADTIEQDDEAFGVYPEISLRDMAILKLSYRIEPSKLEWQRLADAAHVPVNEMKKSCSDILLDADIMATDIEDKIKSLYLKVLELERKRAALARNLDWLSMQIPDDPEAIEATGLKLQECVAAHRKAYRQYQRAQQAHIRRLPANVLADLTGISENLVHQVISRARRKIREMRS